MSLTPYPQRQAAPHSTSGLLDSQAADDILLKAYASLDSNATASALSPSSALSSGDFCPADIQAQGGNGSAATADACGATADLYFGQDVDLDADFAQELGLLLEPLATAATAFEVSVVPQRPPSAAAGMAVKQEAGGLPLLEEALSWSVPDCTAAGARGLAKSRSKRARCSSGAESDVCKS